MRSWTLAIAALLGLTAVSTGAFGAHALADRVTPDRLETFRLAARYQLIHAAVLVGIALSADRFADRARKALDVSITAFLAGVVVFSGSLYVLVLTGQGAWGAVTPVGGLLLHVGWFGLFLAALRSRTGTGS